MSVSILLATYNSEKYIQELIESILIQTNQDFKLLIRDDGSSDKTVQLLRGYEDDKRIKIYYNDTSTRGAQDNFFSLLLYCEDDYIMFADADDVWMPDKIDRALECMHKLEKKNTEQCPLLVHSDLRVTNKNLRIISNSLFKYQRISPRRTKLRQLLSQNVVTGCTVMINRALREMIHKKPYNSVMHDWWLALIASAFGKIGVVRHPCVLYRQHSSNQIGAYNARDWSESVDKLKQRQMMKDIYISMFAQASCFAETYRDQLNPKQLKLCRAYGLMPHMNKRQRVRTIVRYQFNKNTLARNIGQLLLI